MLTSDSYILLTIVLKLDTRPIEKLVFLIKFCAKILFFLQIGKKDAQNTSPLK